MVDEALPERGNRTMDNGNINGIAATIASSARQVTVPGTPQKTTASVEVRARAKDASTGESRTDSTKDPQDSIELSTEAFRLAQSLKERSGEIDEAKQDAADRIQSTAREEAAKTDEAAEASEAKESYWQTQRNARLDRLQTMVRQGLYKVDPFMLDEIAIRMVRMV